MKFKLRAWDNDNECMCDVVAMDWVDGEIITAHLEKSNGYCYKVYPEKDYGDSIHFMLYSDMVDEIKKINVCEFDIVTFTYDNILYSGIVKYVNNGFIIEYSSTLKHIPINNVDNLLINGNLYEGDIK